MFNDPGAPEKSPEFIRLSSSFSPAISSFLSTLLIGDSSKANFPDKLPEVLSDPYAGTYAACKKIAD